LFSTPPTAAGAATAARVVEERKHRNDYAIGTGRKQLDKCTTKKNISKAANVDDVDDRSAQNRGRKMDKHSAQ
jgi:hypothetical protein